MKKENEEVEEFPRHPDTMSVKENLFWIVFILLSLAFYFKAAPNVLEFGFIDGIVKTLF